MAAVVCVFVGLAVAAPYNLTAIMSIPEAVRSVPPPAKAVPEAGRGGGEQEREGRDGLGGARAIAALARYRDRDATFRCNGTAIIWIAAIVTAAGPATAEMGHAIAVPQPWAQQGRASPGTLRC